MDIPDWITRTPFMRDWFRDQGFRRHFRCRRRAPVPPASRTRLTLQDLGGASLEGANSGGCECCAISRTISAAGARGPFLTRGGRSANKTFTRIGNDHGAFIRLFYRWSYPRNSQFYLESALHMYYIAVCSVRDVISLEVITFRTIPLLLHGCCSLPLCAYIAAFILSYGIIGNLKEVTDCEECF